MKTCRCYFCTLDREHPESHKSFERTSGHLLVAESLDPKDSKPMEACTTCGHEREVSR